MSIRHGHDVSLSWGQDGLQEPSVSLETLPCKSKRSGLPSPPPSSLTCIHCQTPSLSLSLCSLYYSAAIAGEKALEHYNDLIELAQGIETYPSATFTRFWLLGLEPAKGERLLEPRTSLAVRTKNKPGALFRVLGCFALRDINVCTIECRPHVRGAVEAHSPWDYTMYLDVDGVPGVDPGVYEAIMNLREFADDVILLGSYPR